MRCQTFKKKKKKKKARSENTRVQNQHKEAHHSKKPVNSPRDKNDPEWLKQSIWLRTMSTEEGERLYELTELGLSVDGAKELREQEKTIEEVYKML